MRTANKYVERAWGAARGVEGPRVHVTQAEYGHIVSA